jgi:small-conductance mechanosensitive channel
LAQENEKLRTPIRAQILDAIHRAQILSAATQPAGGDPDAIAAQRQQFDDLTTRFKQLANIGVPLGEQSVVLDGAKQNLLDWRSALGRQYTRLLRDLLIRICFVAAIILLIAVIASVWKHATFRYIHDARRRRQLLLIRRIVVAGLVVFVIIASVVSEFGSLATFAGLITAGIAVSLQTVILSGVAYFFFIGRFGVRVGDRVTISGITGDVIEIGLFRLYLMELAGAKPDLHATGRIVVFSNSVLFQPSAFYKQLPGAEYAWHEVTFTLAPDTDYRLAEERLMGAVKSVFAEYAQTLNLQHDSAVQELHVEMETPQPRGRLRFVESGLELVVRYPVELHRASEIDDKVTRKLLEAIHAEPKLKLVSAVTPKIQPS